MIWLNALERLAPYGPGNEKLILATHGLKIQSKAPIGRNKEHLKLSVTDEAGQFQDRVMVERCRGKRPAAGRPL